MSFTAETRERTRPVLPLAAMVDMMFLLLIFFMTASLYREQERQIDVTLPGAETAEPGAHKAPIIITVNAEGVIFMGEQAYDLAKLRAALSQLAGQVPNESVLIRGDRQSQFGLVIQVLDMARAVGIQDVAVATTKKAE
jgi:biopolymer transport protein ExbD